MSYVQIRPAPVFFLFEREFFGFKNFRYVCFFWFSCLAPDDCSAVSIFLVIERVSVFCKLFMLLVPYKLSYTIATKVLPHENLSAHNSCRLIPLDKNSGVRPIGISEVLRRIIGKTITQCIKSDLKNLGKNFPTLLRPEMWNRIC